MKNSDGISPKQEKLIGYLVAENTVEAACKKAGINPSTLWRWQQDEKFTREYRKARRSILENAVASLQGLTFDAIETLRRNMSSENPLVEIRCATLILKEAIKGLEVLDLEDRLGKLETVVEYNEKRDE